MKNKFAFKMSTKNILYLDYSWAYRESVILAWKERKEMLLNANAPSSRWTVKKQNCLITIQLCYVFSVDFK